MSMAHQWVRTKRRHQSGRRFLSSTFLQHRYLEFLHVLMAWALPCSCFWLKKAGMFMMFSYFWNFRYRKSNPRKTPWNKMCFFLKFTKRTAWRCIFRVVSLGTPSFHRKNGNNMANKTKRVLRDVHGS